MHWCMLTRIWIHAASCRLDWFLKYYESMVDQSLFRANHLRRIANDSIRLYFAPLVGAVKGIRDEYRSSDRELERRPTTVPPKGNSKS